MRAFILVGGLGTRLQALGVKIPKPMIQINGKPFLEYLLAELRTQNITEIVLCVGYRAEIIEEYFGDGRKFDVDLLYSRESKALGTGGAIKNAEQFAVEENLILNGDSYLELDYHRMLLFHHKHKAQITIACKRVLDQKDYGNISINSNKRILGFSEKLPKTKHGYINGGVYIFDQFAFDFIPPNETISIEKDTFPRAVRAKRCFGFKTNGYFIDIGTPERLQRAQTEFKTELKKELAI